MYIMCVQRWMDGWMATKAAIHVTWMLLAQKPLVSSENPNSNLRRTQRDCYFHLSRTAVCTLGCVLRWQRLGRGEGFQGSGSESRD